MNELRSIDHYHNNILNDYALAIGQMCGYAQHDKNLAREVEIVKEAFNRFQNMNWQVAELMDQIQRGVVENN